MAANKKEDWMQARWRPAMGWLYMFTCAFDFILFPVLWSVLQASMKLPVTQWNPLTLQGAGLYHLAMGAVLGVAAWSRGQEKLAGVSGGSPNGMPPSGGFSGSSVNSNFGASSSPNSWGTSHNSGSTQSNPNNSWSNQSHSPQPNSWETPSSTYNTSTVSLPPPPTKPGVRLSNNSTARVVLPENTNDDADNKIN